MKRRSKYEGYLDALPRLRATKAEFDNPKFSQLVDIKKGEIGQKQLNELLSAYKRARHQKDRLERIEGQLNINIEALAQLIVERYETEDIASMRLASGGSVRKQDDITVKTVDNDQLRLWAVEEGLENKLTLWPATVLAISKERLISGQPGIPGVDMSVRPRLVFEKE